MGIHKKHGRRPLLEIDNPVLHIEPNNICSD